MTKTTPTKKSHIAQLKDLGHTNCDMVEKENVSLSTVSHLYSHYGKTQKIYERKHQSGCPHKLNDCDRCIALQKLSNGSEHNAADLQKKEFPNVSIDTLWWELQIVFSSPVKSSFLTSKRGNWQPQPV